MKFLAVQLSALAVFWTGMSQCAFAMLDQYTPLSKSDKNGKVLLNTVKDTGLTKGKTIKIASAEAKLPEEGNEIIISGHDKKGKTWTLTKQFYGLGSAFFTSDLDNNGSTDIIILQATGACGIAPPAVLTILLFDSQGRPFPVETSGYFSADDAGWNASTPKAPIDDLLHLKGDRKHAVLVCNQLDSCRIKDTFHCMNSIEPSDHSRYR